MNKIIWGALVACVLVGAVMVVLFFGYFSAGVTGAVILDDYVYTRAVCNDENFCADYEIFCDGENFVKMVAVEDSVPVWHDEDWVDFREDVDRLC